MEWRVHMLHTPPFLYTLSPTCALITQTYKHNTIYNNPGSYRSTIRSSCLVFFDSTHMVHPLCSTPWNPDLLHPIRHTKLRNIHPSSNLASKMSAERNDHHLKHRSMTTPMLVFLMVMNKQTRHTAVISRNDTSFPHPSLPRQESRIYISKLYNTFS